MAKLDPNRRTALYRLTDAGGRLLYIGITTDPDARFKKHEGTAPWWPLVTKRALEWHPSRPEAERAELLAIGTEEPLYNRAGSGTPETLAKDFPVGREVSVSALRLRLADVVHASIQGATTYITNGGRPIAAFVPLHVAEAAEAERQQTQG
ncbi:GIY-YIG nuclease family protein [Streptomyces sp. 2P-4]|uniref:GIY-YIG nuclease family protein n=1 Tax=Streptomyces sp. 2P-4 TaxID=2931974 RepID=UPI002541B002|nr:GIY-YIG nuclease family protein [Streptomyces sp. 2P-4]